MLKKTFDDSTIEDVWRKGRIVSGYDSNTWRKDACGAWMKRNEYGNRDNKYGWEIDHVNPNGSDTLINLQPLQWENNVSKSDSFSSNYCVVVV